MRKFPSTVKAGNIQILLDLLASQNHLKSVIIPLPVSSTESTTTSDKKVSVAWVIFRMLSSKDVQFSPGSPPKHCVGKFCVFSLGGSGRRQI